MGWGEAEEKPFLSTFLTAVKSNRNGLVQTPRDYRNVLNFVRQHAHLNNGGIFVDGVSPIGHQRFQWLGEFSTAVRFKSGRN